MVFAIEEINNRTDILPGVELGYKIYDSCGSTEMTTRASLSLLNGESTSAMSCSKPDTVQAIIGQTSSSPSIAIAATVGPLHIPVVSHFATCACLSDKNKYPSFFRTVPSDYYQSRALAKLVRHFGWTWVGTVCSDNDYGNNGINEFIIAAKEEGICVEYSKAFFRTDPREKILKVVETIKASTSKVIVAFVSYSDIGVLFKELALQNVTGIQWIGSESWISDMNTVSVEWEHILIGALGFAIPKAQIKGLGEFLTKLNPADGVAAYTELWETIFNCKFPKEENVDIKQMCSGNESLNEVQNHYTDVSELRLAHNVYKAVYAVAHVLHNKYRCSKRDSGQEDFTECTNITDNKQWQVVNELKKLHFTTMTGEDVYFDENGDPAASLSLREFQNAETMIFAIEQINNRTDILPGVKLGYIIYDSCGSVEMATRASLSLVSHFATCACLSDRKKYPSFFRTVPSDYYQSRALAKLVRHFGWTWVGAICSDNDYGNNGINEFIIAAKEEGICVEYSKAFYRTDPREKILKVVELIKASTSKVIVAFVAYPDLGFLLKEMVLQNMTGFQWIGSESWISDINPANIQWQHILKGAMGFAMPKAHLNGLEEFLAKLSSVSAVSLYKELWETIFDCKFSTQENVEMKQVCTGSETLSDVQNQYTDVSELRVANNVYKAVYAVAYALHNKYGCSELENGQQRPTACTNITNNEPWQVSHFATCACLSDRKKYPSFFRTVPSDYYQSRALAKLVKHFGWTWVGAICSDSDYGNNGINEFITAAKEEGICVEYSKAFFRTDPRGKILKIVETIKASTSKVIVAFVSYSDIGVLLKEMALQNMTGFQWIGSESWISDVNPANIQWQHILKGAIGFAMPKAQIKGLGEFLVKLSPAVSLYKELWETIFDCTFPTQGNVEVKQVCTGYESISQVQNQYTDVSELRLANNVYKAVYAVAYSLHNKYGCSELENGQQRPTACTNITNNEPWQVVSKLQKLNFTSSTGENVFFDANGDPAARYELLNWQQDKDGKTVFVNVGFYDGSLEADFQLSFNNNTIAWAHNKPQVRAADQNCSILGLPSSPQLSKDGDVMIGGIFSFHVKWDQTRHAFTSEPWQLKCRSVSLREFQNAQTMLFAIEEINNRTDILPGVKLGYKIYDSCESIEITTRASLSLVNGNGENVSESSCAKHDTVQAIIGQTSSSPTIAIAAIVGPVQIPVISHFATCACLSDRKKYSSFFRTVPSDYYQSRALAKLVKHFGWTWVGALCSDNDYGNNGINEFIIAAKELGICVEYSMPFFRTYPREKILGVVDIIKASTSKVIVAFVSYSDLGVLLKEMALQNLTGFQWIGSESWISTINPAIAEWQHLLIGSLGFAMPKSQIKGLAEFLTKLNPTSDAAIYKELWETIFECRLSTQATVDMKEMCKGNESLSQVQNLYTDVSELRVANNVYKAVYAVAHALHNRYSCSDRNYGQEGPTSCTNITDNKPWQVVSELKKLNFTSPTGEDVHFDENGDPAARYELLNWQQSKDGKTVFVKVGFYDGSLQTHLQLSLNNISIAWANNKSQVRAADPPCSLLGLHNPPQLRKDGDVMIGGIFSFHIKVDQIAEGFTSGPQQPKCISLSLRELQNAQTMIFAIEQINNRTDILPGVKLGYKIYNSCASIEITTRASLSLVNGNEKITSSMACSKLDTVQAIIGEISSSPSIAISAAMGPLHIPVVSHFATCACLSDKRKYPSFFRTVPSDYYQSRALAKLVKHFGWTWVGALCSDNDYGNNGINEFIIAAKEEGICVEYSKAFFRTDPREKILKVVEIIKASTSKVIVAFVSYSDLGVLLKEMALQNLTGFQWIGSESWISALNPAIAEWQHLLLGSMGFAMPKAQIKGLGEFLTKLNPTSAAAIYKELWETIFECKLPTQEYFDMKEMCKGNESLSQVQNLYTDVSELRVANNVYKAVYAVAHALHNSFRCPKGGSGKEGSTACANITDNKPWQVVSELKKLNFTSPTGEDVHFDENGDPAARTVPSDYYQSRALAKLVKHFGWTWEMALQNLTGFQWIGSESWISSINPANAQWQHLLIGSMGFAMPKGQIKGLGEFLTKVVNEMTKLHFTTTAGEDVYFDKNGDPAARYELLNWQQDKDGKIVFVKVGFYDASLQTLLQLSFNNISIAWAHNKSQ
ncbi:extracellular calcium-sensing receptor-like, partial [Clarias magur]